MPILIGIILFIFAIIIFVAFIVPFTAGLIASMLVGRQAKFDTEDKIQLFMWFYLTVGVLYCLGTVSLQGIFGAVVGGLIWPIGVGVFWMNSVFGHESMARGSDGYWMTMLMFFGFAITQFVAVLMVLQRAREDTSG